MKKITIEFDIDVTSEATFIYALRQLKEQDAMSINYLARHIVNIRKVPNRKEIK